MINFEIYNTLSKRVEEFIPRQEGRVRMYTCGPTVYHYAHIGNLRTYIMQDVLEKSLSYKGYEVLRAMNITDVGHLSSDADTGEDKMALGAKREKKTVREIAQFYTDAFFEDCAKLKIKKPELLLSAMSCIDDYIKIIDKLMSTGYAYFSNGNVYFDTSKIENYYSLSTHKAESLISGMREGVDVDESKRTPTDFVLWFTKSKFDDQELKWDSPWGTGYPGWHIECTGISIKLLGEYLDIHCGGVDNIFPHHTNEIAQSQAYLGHEWCRYWFHSQHLNMAESKMSKSKGEFLTLSLLEEKGYDPLAYRFFCLQSHYRKPLMFTYETLDNASYAYKKLITRTRQLSQAEAIPGGEKHLAAFEEAISSDLNTASALTVLFEVLKDASLTDGEKKFVVSEMDRVLSLGLMEKETEKNTSADVKYIEKMIEKRNLARKEKNFAESDRIRDELAAAGIIIKDTRDGTLWEKA